MHVLLVSIFVLMMALVRWEFAALFIFAVVNIQFGRWVERRRLAPGKLPITGYFVGDINA